MPGQPDLGLHEETIRELPESDISRGLNAAVSDYISALSGYDLGNTSEQELELYEENMKQMFGIYQDEVGEKFSSEGDLDLDEYFDSLIDLMDSGSRNPEELTVEETLSA